MVNRDLEIPRGSDYIMKFEFLGENNLPYAFDEENDLLRLEFDDVEGNYTAYPITIDLENFTNPVSVKLPRVLLDTFDNNPIKYKLVLVKDTDLTLILLCGYINLI